MNVQQAKTIIARCLKPLTDEHVGNLAHHARERTPILLLEIQAWSRGGAH